MTNKTEILKDLAAKKLTVTRAFNAPVEKVWRAWTEAEQLDKWWAPKPWKAITKTMDFTPGGMWLYCMAGPNGEKAWCRVDFHTIEAGKSFTATASFCDENGNVDSSFPAMHWDDRFRSTGDTAVVDITISFDKDEDLEKIVQMGFEQGFTMGLGNLDELLAE
ncbi:SRPBCC domain-containing protein [Mucilaginibacter sp. dw_454]|uniref:SRPBCC family protein n=1 Tax=Mucilaginibacter sp. dw_454 TaxID=2720079 RepID=UPI001BD6009F|nr:SRPBCC domain-containing protein [Mucilaginibacter sp. dw_454]